MIDELRQTIVNIRQENAHANLIIAGDFNMPKIEWEFDDETDLSPKPRAYAKKEGKFLDTMASLGLHQINSNANRHGHYLDLIFTNMQNELTCDIARNDFLIDANSEHHFALDMNLNHTISTAAKTRRINLRNINMRKVRVDMQEINFFAANLTHADITASNTTEARLSASEFADRIHSIQTNCTKKSIIESQTHASHPWERGNLLRRANLDRNRAKKKYRDHPSTENKEALAAAYRKRYTIYNELKRKYYEELIGELDGDKRKFYALMKSKRINNTNIPEIMHKA